MLLLSIRGENWETSKGKLYQELGSESLWIKQRFRKLYSFFKVLETNHRVNYKL